MVSGQELTNNIPLVNSLLTVVNFYWLSEVNHVVNSVVNWLLILSPGLTGGGEMRVNNGGG